MATRKKTAKRKTGRKKTATRKTAAGAQVRNLESGSAASSGAFGAQTTGRMIVTFLDDSKAGVRSALSAMKNQAGVSAVSRASDYGGAFSMADAEGGDALVFDELGMAVLTGTPDQMGAMAAFTPSASANVIVEPEYINHAFADASQEDLDGDLDGAAPDESLPAPDVPTGGGAPSLSYLRGYQAAVDHLVGALSGAPGAAAVAGVEAARAAFSDTAASTWGLKATNALSANSDGSGIKVAVLDTGFDLTHPDFAGRSVQTNSFISGEGVQDGNGHGTHCIGTSCGSVRPGLGPRYGIASGAEIFAGKVLSNAGSGGDASILAGINWALQNKCHVISMSLGRRVQQGEAPQTNYQRAGRKALDAGTLIVAAAGNDSRRPFVTIPVSSPANVGAIAAVAAIDRFLQIASFSNRGINPSGGEINLAGPGVDVHSSWPMPIRLRSISGTSMATPHVAGIAAVVAGESSRFRGLQLYRELRRRVRRLTLPRADVGNGLAQA